MQSNEQKTVTSYLLSGGQLIIRFSNGDYWTGSPEKFEAFSVCAELIPGWLSISQWFAHPLFANQVLAAMQSFIDCEAKGELLPGLRERCGQPQYTQYQIDQMHGADYDEQMYRRYGHDESFHAGNAVC